MSKSIGGKAAARYMDTRRAAAIILGGGRGTRLYPLTRERAKPAVPIGGRYRLVDIPLSNCIHSGINKIAVMTQFNSVSLNHHISRSYRFDAFSGGMVRIFAATQTEGGEDWYQGTADAIRKHLRSFRDFDVDHYVILSGDHLYRMDYRDLLSTHIQHNADITVSALPVGRQAVKDFGILKARKNGRISSFVEKPADPKIISQLVTPEEVLKRFGYAPSNAGQRFLASMGVYCIKAQALFDVLESHPGWIDFGHDVIPGCIRGMRVFAHLFDGFWQDIGTVRSFYEVCIRMTQPNPPFEFYHPTQTIYTRARYLPGSRLQGAVVSNSILCEGCRITGATIKNSIIGIRSVLDRGTQIEDTIMMGADYYRDESYAIPTPIGVGERTKISRAIIDKNARIGKNVVIMGSDKLPDSEGEGYAIRDGIVVILKNGVIPDGARIGA